MILPLIALAVTSHADLPTLWIIGDSTVRNGKGTGDLGQWGWGDCIEEYFDSTKIRIQNRAIGGRSSRTFITDGRWDKILSEAKPGDFLLLQFGHNDPGAINDDSRARGTLKGIGEETEEIENLLTKKHEVVHTYGWYLRKIVREAKEHQITPYVCSYIPRCPRPGSKVQAPGEPTSYRLWAKQVAEAEKVSFIDLYALSYAEFLGKTPEEIHDQFYTAADFTHTGRKGAEANALKVVTTLKRLGALQPFWKN